MFPMTSIMVGCQDVPLAARGEGMFGRLPHAGAKMSCRRGAMERSIASGPKILSVLGGASPRGSLMRVASSGI